MNRDDIADIQATDALKRRTAETSMRVCQICLSPVYDRAKASYLEKGGLRLVVHDSCLAGMVEAISEHDKQEQERDELLQALKTLTKKG